MVATGQDEVDTQARCYISHWQCVLFKDPCSQGGCASAGLSSQPETLSKTK
jgi:hypothetical protein